MEDTTPRIIIRDCADFHVIMYALTCIRIDMETSPATRDYARKLSEYIRDTSGVHEHGACNTGVPNSLYADIDTLIENIAGMKAMTVMISAMERIFENDGRDTHVGEPTNRDQ
jgi:hypothetical protein